MDWKLFLQCLRLRCGAVWNAMLLLFFIFHLLYHLKRAIRNGYLFYLIYSSLFVWTFLCFFMHFTRSLAAFFFLSIKGAVDRKWEHKRHYHLSNWNECTLTVCVHCVLKDHYKKPAVSSWLLQVDIIKLNLWECTTRERVREKINAELENV